MNTKSSSWRARWTKPRQSRPGRAVGRARARPRRRGSPARAASIVIADLHPEPRRERRRRPASTSPRSARWPEIGASSSSPVRRRIAQRAKPTREAEAAADAPGEGGDREVALAARDRGDQRGQLRARVSPRSPSQSTNTGGCGVSASDRTRRAASVSAPPLPMLRGAAHDLRARGRARRAAVSSRRAVVGHEHARARERLARARASVARCGRPRCGRRRSRRRRGRPWARLSCQPASPDRLQEAARAGHRGPHHGHRVEDRVRGRRRDRTRATPS